MIRLHGTCLLCSCEGPLGDDRVCEDCAARLDRAGLRFVGVRIDWGSLGADALVIVVGGCGIAACGIVVLAILFTAILGPAGG